MIFWNCVKCVKVAAVFRNSLTLMWYLYNEMSKHIGQC
jgi:hypothetical protein